ncbi:uncharacterized protein LY79DRAFT_583693 [Colletotrichum navitas]|uniref:Uncharacterized protein n=1 Tax=Colletotrichum navitas TaxID=681940 RepID=A0AAD8PND5_9PEZI|nr:uncharacterized protein LY79DRAFT_583693 [Colletotrichum navitas]KAK1573369.1 hypothetical protein LY79DRAFT_583693 [Colletotrichum navitas]
MQHEAGKGDETRKKRDSYGDDNGNVGCQSSSIVSTESPSGVRLSYRFRALTAQHLGCQWLLQWSALLDLGDISEREARWQGLAVRERDVEVSYSYDAPLGPLYKSLSKRTSGLDADLGGITPRASGAFGPFARVLRTGIWSASILESASFASCCLQAQDKKSRESETS